MGVLTSSNHEFWATVSGRDIEDVANQQAAAWKWGVAAIELRADIMSDEAYEAALATHARQGPTLVAHFGTADETDAAVEAIRKGIDAGLDGGICHSRCEAIDEIRVMCRSANRLFASAYHSQQPITLADAIEEFARQQTYAPLFTKIAVRAETVEDAVAMIQATRRASEQPGAPVVGAIFGPHRWARIALPHAGSAISFLIAHRVANEVAGDDEQLQFKEADLLQRVRGVYPQKQGAHAFVQQPYRLSNRRAGVPAH
jgi:3-dehydroquinate dehydratase